MNNNNRSKSNSYKQEQTKIVRAYKRFEVSRQLSTNIHGLIFNIQQTAAFCTDLNVNGINNLTYSKFETSYFSLVPSYHFQSDRSYECGAMSLSVVSVAMHLSGLDAQHFTSGDQKVRWLYEDSARKLHASSPALSTTSTASSSGFNSWASDQNNAKEDVTLTPTIPPQKTEQKESVIMYEGRNILDLGANLRDPTWNFRPSELPKDPQHFFNNRSQYSRVNGDQVPLHVDVPCEFCDFVIPYYD